MNEATPSRVASRVACGAACGAACSAALILTSLLACSGQTGGAKTESGAAAETDSTAEATPVRVATAVRGNMARIVAGPGRTDALDVQKVRAPFTGTLEALHVSIGDHVRGGQLLGTVVAQASQAALAGAEAMSRAAATPAQRSDAARALELAKANIVQTPLRAPRAGTVVSRGASQGDLVSQGDSIVSIASAGSIVFLARIAQMDIARIRPGQHADVVFPGRPTPVRGVVHGLLPADTSAMTVPVRIDLLRGNALSIGLFGTTRITVGEASNVTIVPLAALLRDDVSGITRMAVVSGTDVAHWITVTTGLQQGDSVEITSPPLAAGERVILSGQVGLPEGSRVRVVTDSGHPAASGGSAGRAGAAP
ncbi:MAG: efflux RND transporter periplasmic adaptor subunit [Gemmatimonadaceae bacterium]